RTMPDDKPFALHETWTCYGTWLPGDSRGYVSNTLGHVPGFLPRENVPGTPYTADDPRTRAHARALQQDSTVLLTRAQAQAVATALVDSARKGGWTIVRAAVMANHVTVAVMTCTPDGEAVP